MNIKQTQGKSPNNMNLKIVSKDLSQNPRSYRLTNDNADISVIISTDKNSHAEKKCLPDDLIDLWNGYNNLPSEYRFRPETLFKAYLNAEQRVIAKQEEVSFVEQWSDVFRQERDDARTWNTIYRWSLFFIIMCLIAYASH